MSYSKDSMDITSPTVVPQLLACGDSYCPRLTDPISNRVICRCYQGPSSVPSHIPNFAAALYHSHIPGEIPSPVTSPMQPSHGMRWDPSAVPSLGFGSPFPVMAPGQQSIDTILRSQMYSYMHSTLDASNSRRKNATRETTAALKAWLKEHRKNPYPTKAEKIMLAIITRMTLTQVSTWFANARRRLKKENRGEFSSDISFDNMSSSSDDEESTPSIFKAENISRPETTTPIDDLPGYSSIRNEIQSYPSFSFHSSRPITSTPIDHNMNNLPMKSEETIKANVENDNLILGSEKEEVKMDNDKEHVNSNKDIYSLERTVADRPRFLPPLISKPKIWSISNIIGQDSVTNNTHNDTDSKKD